MNIAFIHYSAPPVVGGVETVLKRQAQQCKQAGHQVWIIAGRGQNQETGIPVQLLPFIDSNHPRVLRIKSSMDRGHIPDDFSKLITQIEEELSRAFAGMDVVIVHNVASLHKNLAFTAALYRISQKPKPPRFILWHHDLAWTTPRYQSEMHNGWPWDLLRKSWNGVTQVTISEFRREELSKLMGIPEKMIHVVPAGLDMIEFLGLENRTIALCEQLNLFAAGPILLAPVRITRRKNLELAIATMAELIKKMPDARLVVTGPPGAHNPTNVRYFKDLQKLRQSKGVDKAVHLLAEFNPDGLPGSVVADFFKIADALLMPSSEEGFGIPLLEAGLSRIPIFCSDIPQLKALAGDYASYFSPHDAPEFVAGMIVDRLSHTPSFQWRMKVRREYTWEAIYQQKIVPLLE
ncbi:MAG: glycosyltransferase family 4 protein [Anaerolineaceae bacterium]|nr:glycosyltransferase family 4 protein [Anaerolineaceae bacterium]